MVTRFERGIEMLSKTEALQFAHGWVRAWNSHDLDAVMSHYAPEVVLTSPTAANLLGDPSGTVAGKEAVRSYFARGLEAFPNLTFELLDVMWGVSSVVLYYVESERYEDWRVYGIRCEPKGFQGRRKLHVKGAARRRFGNARNRCK
jgi:hypothetical protein